MGSRSVASSMDMFRRHNRNNRDRYDHPYYNRYPRGIDAYFEDLAIDSRRRLMGSRFADIRGMDPQRETRRIFEPGRLPPGHTFEEYIDADPVLRSRPMGLKNEVLPVGRAMTKLFEQLVKAEEFYNTFQSDYDNDIMPIKRYADVDILNKLWVLRIVGKKDSNTADVQDRNDDESLEASKELFEDMKRDVSRALEVAVESTLKEGSKQSRKTSSRVNSARRMRQKIDTAHEQIWELLGLVRKDREHCVALLGELDLLKQLVDPESPKNKELYKSENEDSGVEDGDDES